MKQAHGVSPPEWPSPMIDAITHIITNTTPRGGISKEQARIAAEKIGELIAAKCPKCGREGEK